MEYYNLIIFIVFICDQTVITTLDKQYCVLYNICGFSAKNYLNIINISYAKTRFILWNIY